MDTKYHPSSLVLIKGKWYVVVTKPKELQGGKNLQVRRSTGTTDKKIARQRQAEITQKIYQGFETDLGTASDLKLDQWSGITDVQKLKDAALAIQDTLRSLEGFSNDALRPSTDNHLDLLDASGVSTAHNRHSPSDALYGARRRSPH